MVLGIVGLLLMAVARDFVPLLVGRFVMGIGVGMAVPAIRRIVIVADPERIGHNLGRLLAADVAGFAAGPAVVGAARRAVRHPGAVPRHRRRDGAGPPVRRPHARVAETAEPPPQRLAFDLLRIRPFAGAVALGCAVWLMIGAFDALWAVVLDDLDTSDWIANLGITLFALPLVSSARSVAAWPSASDRSGWARSACCSAPAFMLLYGLVPSGGAMFAVAMVHSVSDGLTVSSTASPSGWSCPASARRAPRACSAGSRRSSPASPRSSPAPSTSTPGAPSPTPSAPG